MTDITIQDLEASENAVKILSVLEGKQAKGVVAVTKSRTLEGSIAGKVEFIRESVIQDFTVRALYNQGVGLYTSSDFSDDGIAKAVQTAIDIAKVNKTDEGRTLPEITGMTQVSPPDEHIEKLQPEEMMKTIETMTSIVNESPKISGVRGLLRAGILGYSLAITGHNPQFTSTSFVGSYFKAGAKDKGKTGSRVSSFSGSKWNNFVNTLEETAETIRDEAIRSLGADQCPTGTYTILIPHTLWQSILSFCVPPICNARAVQKGRSPWKDRLGEQIGSDIINIKDSGTIPGAGSTKGFDAEGVPQQDTALLQNGVLKGYLYDCYTAEKDGVASTGNAQGYNSVPTPGVHTLIMENGDSSLEEMIQETKKGILALEAISLHTINAQSGRVVMPINVGCMIENGEISDPIRNIVASGNFHEILLSGIDLLGNEKMLDASIMAPSVKLNPLRVSGK